VSSQAGYREAAYALGIGLDLLVFALVGYFLGKYLLNNAALGIAIGVMVGTALMWYSALKLSRASRAKSMK